MAYDLDWVTSGLGAQELTNKARIVLQPNTTNTRNDTSLVLFGKGAPNYGEGQQENFLRILENFAAPTAPVNPTIGQLWYDSSIKVLKIYDVAGNWVPIGVFVSETAPSSPFVGQLWFKDSTNNFFIYGGSNIWVPLDNNPLIRVAYNYEYNKLVDLYNNIVASNTVGTNCSNSYGWNQASRAISKLYIPAHPVTNTDWQFLLGKWQEIAPIVGIDPAKFVSNGFIITDHLHIDETQGATGEAKGIATVLFEYEKAVDAAAQVYANRFNFAAATMEMQSYSSIARTSYWTNETYLNIEFQWTSVAEMNHFFLTGGYLKIVPTLSSIVLDPTSEIWQSLILSLGGGIIIKACGTSDVAGNPAFSLYRSVFELPDSSTAWPNTAVADSIGLTLYKAHETLTATNGYGGGAYTAVNGNDSDIGWADITVEARRKTATNKLQVRITFDNETGAAVKGLLGCNLSSFKSSANWGTFVPSPVSAHPIIDAAVSVFS